MKQVVKKVVVAVIAVTMMFGMTFVMTSCNKGDDQNVDLRQILEDLQDRINDLEERLEALEEENAALRKELEELQRKLEEMRNPPARQGEFFSLPEAYIEGLLTRNDLKHISYFRYGIVREMMNEEMQEWVQIDFSPQITRPDINELDSQILKDITNTIYLVYGNSIHLQLNWLIGQGLLLEGTCPKTLINVTCFLGEYNGHFAIRFDGFERMYLPTVSFLVVDGLAFTRHSSRNAPIEIFTFS